MKKLFLIFIIGAVIFFGFSLWVSAEESSLDYDEIEKVMDEMLPDAVRISFADLVERLVQGDFKYFFNTIGKCLKEQLFSDMKNSHKLLVQMIGIILISAVFTNFSMAFSKTYISETGFYLTYIMLFTLMLTSFITAAEIVSSTLRNILKFMSALIPVYCLAVTLTGNIQTGIWYQQVIVAGMTFIEWFIYRIVLRLVYIYVLISLVNQLSKEDVLSKSANLMKAAALWITKALMGVFLGIQFIQGLILPAFDTLKNGWAARLTSVIPGVGDTMGSVMKTVIGSAVLIKNSIGAAGIIVLTLLFLIPACELILLIIMYMIAQAIVQPVADKRMVSCLHSVCEGIIMMLKIEGSIFILFFLSMAIMSFTSGSVFGG